MPKKDYSKITFWIHINFIFKCRDSKHRENYYLNSKNHKIFRNYLAKLINKIDNSCGIERRFFLYEPNPHCFLALEFERIPDNFEVLLKCLDKPKFIKDISWKYSADEGNGKLFLDCLDKITNVILSNTKKFPKWLKSMPSKQRLFAHIIHCSLNSLTNSRVEELKFYRRMIKLYRRGLTENAKSKYRDMFFKSF